MSKRAPAATRALAILDFLALHPTETFTLSELAREFDIGSGSAHALLTAMTEAGYLTRHPTHKTYRLGPSTIAVGNAALESHPAIDIARDEMRRITDDLDLECLASAPLGDEVVVVARVGKPHPGRPLSRIGRRRPLVPPLGTMYLAWSGDAVIDAWLARSEADPDLIERYRHLLTSARALGYSVGIGRERSDIIAVAPLPDDPMRLDLDPERHYDLAYIAASVFDERGEVALVLNLDGFTTPYLPDEITKLARRFRDVTDVITRGIHGQPPELAPGA
jgi:DNA-binding IclR family transcriptional regulator